MYKWTQPIQTCVAQWSTVCVYIYACVCVYMCACVIFYKSTKTNQWKKHSLFNNGTGTNGYPYVKK